MEWASAVGAGTICLGAGFLGFIKYPRSSATGIFMLAMASVFAAMVTAPLYPMIDPLFEETALAVAKASVISILLMSVFLFGLAMVYPVERTISIMPPNAVTISIVAGVVLAFAAGSLVDLDARGSAMPSLSESSSIAVTILGLTLTVLTTGLILASRQKANAIGRRTSIFFLVGLWVFIGSGLLHYAALFGYIAVSPDASGAIMTAGVTVAGLLFAYPIARGQMIMTRPVHEAHLSSSKATYKLRHRLVYLVIEQKPDFAFKIFNDVIKGRCTDCANDDSFACESLDCVSCNLPCPCRTCNKYKSRPQGLIVTRQYPHEVRAKYFLQTTPITWLSSVAGKDNMDPAKLSLLTDYLVNFMEKSQNGVILMDGLEYIVTNNDFPRLLKAMDKWTETAMTSNGVLIMSIDDRSFEPKELALMERNREVVRPDAPESWMIIPERV